MPALQIPGLCTLQLRVPAFLHHDRCRHYHDHSRLSSVRRKSARAVVWLDHQRKPSWLSYQLVPACSHSQHLQPCLKKEEPQLGHLNVRKELSSMDHFGIVPSESMYLSLLKSCCNMKDLGQAKRVQAHLSHNRIKPTGFLGEYLVATLAKCGGLDDALQVFHALPWRTAFSWTALLSAFVDCGQVEDALTMFDYMQQDGMEPNRYTFISLLKACGILSNIALGAKLHANAWSKGLASDYFVGSTLVSMYGKCGSISDAENVFYEMPHSDIVLYNAMLSAYAEQGQGEKALQLYNHMKSENLHPNKQTFLVILHVCGALAEKESTRVQQVTKGNMGTCFVLHVDAVTEGYASDLFVGSTLLSMYGKCGAIKEAENVLGGLSHRNVVSWGAMLSAYVQQGLSEKALLLYRQLQEESLTLDTQVYLIALQACNDFAEKQKKFGTNVPTKLMALEIGKALHADARRKGFGSNSFVISNLISLYGKCEAMSDAQNLFNTLLHSDVVAWTAMVAAYVEYNQGEEALLLYKQMQIEGVNTDRQVFLITLQACGVSAEAMNGLSTRMMLLEIAQALGVDAWNKGLNSDVFIGSGLVNTYGKCGALEEAENVFSGLPYRDLTVWNAMLSAYVEQGREESTLLLYRQMIEDDVSPDCLTFIFSLQACASLASKEGHVVEGQLVKHTCLEIGRAFHADACSKGLTSDVFLENTIMTMYGKCGSIAATENVFLGVAILNDVSLNVMLSAYVEQGLGGKALQLYRQIQGEGTEPSSQMFVTALQACIVLMEKEGTVWKGNLSKKACLEIGQALHSDVLKTDFPLDVTIVSSLIIMYSKLGSITEAETLFSMECWRDEVSWSVLLSAYNEQGEVEKALQLYRQMREEGVNPDGQVFAIMLQVCSTLACYNIATQTNARILCLEIGMALHVDSRREGFGLDVLVGGPLIHMYGKCGAVVEAENAFLESFCNKPLSLWNALLSTYIDQAEGEKALRMFAEMHKKGTSPSKQTYVLALQACRALADNEEGTAADESTELPIVLEIGEALHHDILEKGLGCDIPIVSTLMTLYGKCGSIVKAKRSFDDLLYRDSVTWSAMLAVYVEQGCSDEALDFLRLMCEERVDLDDVAVAYALQACSDAGSMEVSGQLHSATTVAELTMDTAYSNSLIYAYGSCASMVDAQAVFDRLTQPDIGSWNACILGYAKEGNFEASLQMFDEMLSAGIRPNGTTFLSILISCCHSGLVEDGLQYFDFMSRQSDMPLDLRHFTILIDLLGRAGDLVRVENLLWHMPRPASLAIWLCVLGACRIHAYRELAKQVFDCAMRWQSKEPAIYVLMSNIYACAEVQGGQSGRLGVCG